MRSHCPRCSPRSGQDMDRIEKRENLYVTGDVNFIIHSRRSFYQEIR